MRNQQMIKNYPTYKGGVQWLRAWVYCRRARLRRRLDLRMSLTTAAIAIALTAAPGVVHADDGVATYAVGNFGSAGATNASVDVATGTARASYPLVFPPARAQPQPILSLQYSHVGGMSEVGKGWSLGLPVIERRGLAGGPPRFDENDVYYLSGTPLLFVCGVSGTTCSANGSFVLMPQWASGWTMYRPAVDPAYTRVFKFGDTWRVQQQSGAIMEFGVPRLAPGIPAISTGAVDYTATNVAFRWKLVGQAEAYVPPEGPKNVIGYSWVRDTTVTPKEISVLADIYYTPAVQGGNDVVTGYAHHIHFAYGTPWQGPRRRLVDEPAWLLPPPKVVTTIDVASMESGSSTRQQVRRYHLQYTTVLDRPHLVNITMEGRCSAPTLETPQSAPGRTEWILPTTQNCAYYGRGTWYQYALEAAEPMIGWISFVSPDGVGGFQPAAGPQINARSAAMVDVNRDGLADLVQSNPPRLYLNNGLLGSHSLGPGGEVWNANFVLAPQFGVAPYLDAFKDKSGLSVFGIWSQSWGAAFLYRGAGTTSAAGYQAGVYYGASPGQGSSARDGAPLALLEIAPTGNPNQWALGSRPTHLPQLPAPHVYGDLDGDGTVDILYYDDFTQQTLMALSPRTALGTITSFPSSTYTNLQLRAFPNGPKYAALAT